VLNSHASSISSATILRPDVTAAALQQGSKQRRPNPAWHLMCSAPAAAVAYTKLHVVGVASCQGYIQDSGSWCLAVHVRSFRLLYGCWVE
jgi:hypothetical protein